MFNNQKTYIIQVSCMFNPINSTKEVSLPIISVIEDFYFDSFTNDA